MTGTCLDYVKLILITELLLNVMTRGSDNQKAPVCSRSISDMETYLGLEMLQALLDENLSLESEGKRHISLPYRLS